VLLTNCAVANRRRWQPTLRRSCYTYFYATQMVGTARRGYLIVGFVPTVCILTTSPSVVFPITAQ